MSAAHIPTSMNHVFVDFENVHQIDLSVIGARSVSFTLLMGARQTSLDAALVEKLMAHAATVQLVRLNFSGKNALDFTLAYYVGRAVMTDPTGHFHIVSRDTGFDPLIQHLRSRHINAHRHNDFTTLTFSGAPKPQIPQVAHAAEDLWTRVLEHLNRNVKNRPKRKKTLVSHLLSFSGKSATEADAMTLIDRLNKEGRISIGAKDAVTYFD